jgi:hypothetical protein
LGIGTTVGIVGVCHGYPEKLNGWIHSIHQLNRKPDEVVLVLWTGIDRTDLNLDGIKVVDWDSDFAYSDMMNLAVQNCDTDWIAWIGVDDRYRTHALDLIDNCAADVLALGFQYDTGQIWTPAKTNADEILSMRANMIPCGSPFRKWLWEKIPFDQSIAPFDDWVFWLGTALSKATYDSTLDIDVDYEYEGHWSPSDSDARLTIADWLSKTLMALGEKTL